MSVTGAIVLYAVTWFMVFFILLPIRVQSQDEAGDVVPGTPRGAPSGFVVRRKAVLTTVVATVVWAVLCAIIWSGVISLRDIDVMGRMPPASAR
ncbi:DUF1467 family protein [Rhodobacter sp. CZR27]|uniref:DUF1467 family protein n=1 Tax=Rhodobacter sp. CZR27 TaxID=2033869 RepID=UPI000BBEBE12|nr:DUF1467 family protein [Rhodobacter sp. CZR27]